MSPVRGSKICVELQVHKHSVKPSIRFKMYVPAILLPLPISMVYPYHFYHSFRTVACLLSFSFGASSFAHDVVWGWSFSGLSRRTWGVWGGEGFGLGFFSKVLPVQRHLLSLFAVPVETKDVFISEFCGRKKEKSHFSELDH